MSSAGRPHKHLTYTDAEGRFDHEKHVRVQQAGEDRAFWEELAKEDQDYQARSRDVNKRNRGGVHPSKWEPVAHFFPAKVNRVPQGRRKVDLSWRSDPMKNARGDFKVLPEEIERRRVALRNGPVDRGPIA